MTRVKWLGTGVMYFMSDWMLSEDEKRYLLKLARGTLEKYFKGEEDLVPKDVPFESLKEKKGTFVTLNQDGELRGCIGHILPVNPVYVDVVENSVNAAFKDPRFPGLKEDELKDVKIEVSVLSVPKKLDYKTPEELLEKLRLNVDGVVLNCDGRSSTFLPQVWEKLPDKEAFLSQLCMKAWLEPECWKKDGCKIEVYQVDIFEE